MQGDRISATYAWRFWESSHQIGWVRAIINCLCDVWDSLYGIIRGCFLTQKSLSLPMFSCNIWENNYYAATTEVQCWNFLYESEMSFYLECHWILWMLGWKYEPSRLSITSRVGWVKSCTPSYNQYYQGSNGYKYTTISHKILTVHQVVFMTHLL